MSFKFGYMRQRSGFSLKPGWRQGLMAQKEGGTAMMCSPLPLHKIIRQIAGAPSKC